MPYAIGTYRDAWLSFPVLVRQYHPDLNGGIVLSQIPPAAEVLLQWQCEAGHVFVATPSEQRSRPGRERRRSSWCPECLQLAAPKPIRPAETPTAPARKKPAKKRRPVCTATPDVATGTAFQSNCAPLPASAVEGRLRADLAARLEFDASLNAIKVGRPFFEHTEVWPDIVLADLRVAIEYDSTGRHGLEHVGRREAIDRRKDRLLREAGWEVVRIRTGRLPALGPHDLCVASASAATVERLLDRLGEIRGALFVDAYRR